jgi:hypothetical protein
MANGIAPQEDADRAQSCQELIARERRLASKNLVKRTSLPDELLVTA